MPLIQISEFRNYSNLSTNLKQIPPKPSYFQDHWCGRSDFLYLRRGKDILQSYRAVPVTLVPLRCTWLMNIWGWGWLVWSFWECFWISKRKHSIYRYICVWYTCEQKKVSCFLSVETTKKSHIWSPKEKPMKIPMMQEIFTNLQLFRKKLQRHWIAMHLIRQRSPTLLPSPCHIAGVWCPWRRCWKLAFGGQNLEIWRRENPCNERNLYYTFPETNSKLALEFDGAWELGNDPFLCGKRMAYFFEGALSLVLGCSHGRSTVA